MPNLDPMTIMAGVSAVKTAFETLRSAIGLVRETKDLLPNDAKTAVITAALDNAETSSKLAEAEVAKALGYELCKCEFPPTPVLTVGMSAREPKSGPVFECPKCGVDTSYPYTYHRTVPYREPSPAR
jgi:hypothetical protein